jgi:cytochrome c-type biogenesis protein CcmF
MIFADIDLAKNGKPVGRISPAKFIYKSMGEAPSTEVARYVSARDDLYVVVGMVNPQTKVAAFQMHVNTLISFIWLGGIILFFGAVVAMWPEVVFDHAGAWGYVRAAASVATMVMFGTLLAAGAGQAYGAPPLPHGAWALTAPSVSIPQP